MSGPPGRGASLGLLAACALAAACLFGPFAQAQGSDQSAPAELTIGPLIDDGSAIAQQQKAATTSLQRVGEDETQSATLKTSLDQTGQSLNAQAADFNMRCNHPFVAGQEDQVAACKAEQQRDLPAFQDFVNRQVAYKATMDDIRKRRQAAEQQQAAAAVLAEAWKRRARALVVTAEMQACLSASTEAAAGVEHMEMVVLAYRHCWDGGK